MLSTEQKYLIKKYGGAVPRYTSYPTAVQFDDRFTQDDAISCLRTVKAGEPVSLYIHIPFCHSLCHYCGCHTKIVSHTKVISAYIDTLCREIQLAAAYMSANVPISRVHFGGGSPNYAPIADLKKIMQTIRSAFPASMDMQIDMECDPRLLNDSCIEDLAHIGLRRVSLGIQDFDRTVQEAVNRVQTPEHITSQVERLRHHGIHDINFDLIVGLPEQTRQSVRKTAEQTVKLRPARIAVFAYAHVPWMKKHQALLERYRFPTPVERFAMQEDIKHILQAAGYRSIGIDHYALPEDSLLKARDDGTMQRNFQGYTDDPAAVIIGLGLSAISQYKNAYAQNTLDAPTYRKNIDAGQLPVAKGYTLTPQDIEARKAIMQIMCRFQIDTARYPDVPVSASQLALLEQDGLIRQKGNLLTVTDAGKPFTRVVASCFDSYYQQDSYKKEGRHAKAV